MGNKTAIRIVIAFFFGFMFLTSAWPEENKDLSTTEVTVVVGKTAMLPCDTVSDSYEDRVYMVLVFKQPYGKPIYRKVFKLPRVEPYDVRGRPFEDALEWSDESVFATRARFITNSHPTALKVENVQLDDEGTYRCRVDFKNSPTKNYQIMLKVIVPPHKIVLYDENGRDLAGVIGPLEEGDNVSIICEIRGGRPQPELIWSVNGTELPNHAILKNDGKVLVSRILLSPAERSWHNNIIRCQANNTELMSPHERTARIEMLLNPEYVKITNKPGILKAEKEITLICITNGSRPAAHVTWWKNNHLYKKGRVEKYANESVVVDKLTMVPYPEDDGAVFKCRAENPFLGTAVEDSFKMTVHYRPVIVVSLGRTLNPNDIKEGDDVYFECSIKANPKEHRISWLRNDVVIRGKFASTKSLVRQKVTKKDVGLYSCRATNSEGETTSTGVYLRVQYVPVCSHPDSIIVGVLLQELLRVRCTVYADPANVQFLWKFNNSDLSFQVSAARYAATGGTSSELFYSASTDRDFGTLLCLARNSVGLQEKACVFHIVQATRPQTPRDCTWLRVRQPSEEDDYLAVRCKGSYDYFMPQHYTLEVLGKNYRVLLNSTDSYPGLYTTTDQGTVRIISGEMRKKPRRDFVFWLNISWASLDIFEDEKLAVITYNPIGPSDAFILKDFVYEPISLKDDSLKGPTVLTALKWTAYITFIVITITGLCIIVYVNRFKPTPLSQTNKGPSQSVVQVDTQGRRRVVAVSTPTPVENKTTSTSPDLLHSRPGAEEPPRVVLASAYNNMLNGLDRQENDDSNNEDIPLEEVRTR